MSYVYTESESLFTTYSDSKNFTTVGRLAGTVLGRDRGGSCCGLVCQWFVCTFVCPGPVW